MPARRASYEPFRRLNAKQYPLEWTRLVPKSRPSRYHELDHALTGGRFRISRPLVNLWHSHSENDMASITAARRTLAALTFALAIAPASFAHAQQPAAAPPPQTGPKVGEMAPDFTLPGATRYGLLKDPVTLSALRGKTIVLAFFVKARTRG